MLKTNREFCVISQNRAEDKIMLQKRKSPAQIGRVGMSASLSEFYAYIASNLLCHVDEKTVEKASIPT